MSLAIKEAIKARKKNEVPVGAIIVDRCGNVIAKAHNLVETRNDPTCHAEKLVIEEALKITGQKFLNNCDIWVTLEPCVMCAGALTWSQLERIVYGVGDPKRGFQQAAIKLHPKTKVTGGVMEADALKILQDFFLNKRK